MVESFLGDWKLVSTENVEEILLHFGVNYFLRKLIATVKPNAKIEFNENDHKWSFLIYAPFKTIKTEFEIGKEFEEVTPYGKKVKSIVHVENNKFIQTQRDMDKGNVECIIIRELVSEDEHWVLMEAGNIVAKRVFHRIKQPYS